MKNMLRAISPEMFRIQEDVGALPPESERALADGIPQVQVYPDYRGIASIGQGIAAGVMRNRLLQSQKANADASKGALAALFGGGSDAPRPAATGGTAPAPTAALAKSYGGSNAAAPKGPRPHVAGISVAPADLTNRQAPEGMSPAPTTPAAPQPQAAPTPTQPADSRLATVDGHLSRAQRALAMAPEGSRAQGVILGRIQQLEGVRSRLEGEETARNDPLRQIEMRKAQLGLQAAERSADPNAAYDARAAAAEKYGLQRGTREFNEFVMTGDFPRAGSQPKDLATETRAREAEAQRMGLTPGTGPYQSYVLTGKMPREDQQPLTATDKKAILEADEMVHSNELAIKSLDNAKAVSPRAYEGFGANTRAWLGNNAPDLLMPDFIASPERSKATTELDNILATNALSQLKAIFGGAPTEGERKILLDLQGAANQPESVRQDILRRARDAATARLEFNRQRSSGLRGGEFFKPQGANPQARPQAAPTSGGAPGAPQETRTMGGKTYVKINGQWFEQ